MIRNNPLAVTLVSALFLLALLCCWFAVWWFFGMRELQTLKGQFQWMNKTSSTVQALANEAAEYSRRNPSIDPVLIQFEVKSRPAAAPAATNAANIKATR